MGQQTPRPTQSPEADALNDTLGVLRKILRHMKEGNLNQVELLAAVVQTNTKQASIMRQQKAVLALCLLVLLMGVAQVFSLVTASDAVESSHRAQLEAHMEQQKMGVVLADTHEQLKKTQDDLHKTRETVQGLSEKIPQLRMDKQGTLHVDVAVSDEAAKKLSKRSGNKYKRAKGSRKASLPVAGRQINF